MNKQELIEKYEYELKLLRLQFGEILRTKVYEELLDYLKQLDEPQKVTIPQFVADWLEQSDWREETLGKQSVFDVLDNLKNGCYENVKRWIDENGDLFARAWLDGYEVKKEKRYTVKIKAYLGQFLGRYYINNEELTPRFTRSQFTGKGEIPTFTRKELEQTGFGWVFDCPGMEVEEVE